MKEWIARDPILSCVRRFVQIGWPDLYLGDEYKSYVSKKNKLEHTSLGLTCNSSTHGCWRSYMTPTPGPAIWKCWHVHTSGGQAWMVR